MDGFSLFVIIAGYAALGLCLIVTIREVRSLNLWKKEITDAKAKIENWYAEGVKGV